MTCKNCEEKDARIAELENDLHEARETLAARAGDLLFTRHDIKNLKAQLKQFEWQPIESYEDQYDYVLLYDGNEIHFGYQIAGTFKSISYDETTHHCKVLPTHWMPLPSPLKEEE